MHYYIDGHNLIAKMPDIGLDDPNDEALLVLRLRSWVSGGRKRRATVIFDGGLPGGRSRFHSSSQLKVIFASEGRTADALLIRRIQRASNPAEYTLVSSDLQVVDAARARRMKHISAEEFARQLSELVSMGQDPAAPQPVNKSEDPAISQEEVAAWLEMFEAAPKVQQKTPETKKRQKPTDRPPGNRQIEETRAKSDPVDPTMLKSGEGELSGDELDDWLKLFGQGD